MSDSGNKGRLLKRSAPDIVKPLVKAARGKPGPVPRSVRYAGARKAFEQRVALALPEIFEVLMKAAKGGDSKAATWLAESVLGRPAPAAVAPVDDHTLPADARQASTVEQMVIADLTDQALTQVKRIITADLISQGKLPVDATVQVGPTDRLVTTTTSLAPGSNDQGDGSGGGGGSSTAHPDLGQSTQ